MSLCSGTGELRSLLAQLAGAFILKLSISDGAGGAARELQAETAPSLLTPELLQAALLSPSCDLHADVFAEEGMCPDPSARCCLGTARLLLTHLCSLHASLLLWLTSRHMALTPSEIRAAQAGGWGGERLGCGFCSSAWDRSGEQVAAFLQLVGGAGAPASPSQGRLLLRLRLCGAAGGHGG